MSPGTIATRIARIRAPLSAKLQGAFLVIVGALVASGVVSISGVAHIQEHVSDLARLDERATLTRALDYSIVAQEHLSSMFVLTGEATYQTKLVAEQERFRATAARLRDHRLGSDVVGAVEAAFARYVSASRDVVAAKRAGRDRQAAENHVAREHVIAHEIETLTRQLVSLMQAERQVALGDILREQRLVTLIVTGLLIASLALTILLSVVLARSIVRPIREVDAALERIGRGEFGAVANVANRDEVGSLVAHVNHMSAQLADVYAKEREARAALEAQIAEVRRTQAQLIQSEKLRALGEMSAGVAHDFNNLLASVLGQAELLLDRLEDGGLAPAEADRRLRLIQQAALDGAETVRRLLEFTRGTPTDSPQEPVDLSQVVQAVLAVAEPRWKDEAHAHGRDISVVTDVDAVPPMLGHPAALREVLLNLVFNAIDAMPHGGRLTVSARRDGDTVRISVADTGAGMTPDVAGRVFEPFFTTKGPQRSGLGLSVSYGIVQRHGGNLTVVSTPGEGAVFTIGLPFRPAPRVAVRTVAAGEAGGLRVLVVDDEKLVRETLRSICESGGHRVSEAASGREAIDLLARAPVDLVCTDLGMPGMTGWQLADHIVATYPQVKVALVTGWSARVEPELLRDHGVSALIPKPFRRADVLAILAGFTRNTTARA